jgi:membrane carboxypeptidase/penicillin-binding protein PbpC
VNPALETVLTLAPIGGAMSTVAGLVWGFMASRTKAADAASAALVAALTGEAAAARAERDHERAERLRERLEAAALTAELGRRMDRIREKAAADAAAVALEIARMATPEQMRRANMWEEMPTMVRKAGEIAAAAVSPSVLPEREARRLVRYSKGERLTTPPEGVKPPPRSA